MVGEAADRDAAVRRVAFAFPEDAGAAIWAEMKADLEPAVAFPSVDLVLTFNPHLAFQPTATIMYDRAGAALAGLAMTDIHAFGLSRRNCPQLTAMAFGDSLHVVLPNFLPFSPSRPKVSS